MDENYEELFERLREKCRRQRWHGPDMNNPFTIVEQMRANSIPEKKGGIVFRSSFTSFWYDRHGKQYAITMETDLENFPLQTDFEYPPATEEQLAATEALLGYSLPPLLRTLYSTVANGGFGPGYGLEGVNENVDSPNDEQHGRWRWVRAIDLGIYLRRHTSSETIALPSYVWPDRLFPLCHWGCGIYSHLDCASGRVFWGDRGRDACLLRHQASSLYEWLDLWANGMNFGSSMYPEGQDDE